MRRRLPSLQALAVFEAAARHQSYTRAAQELALTQSAVSRQMAALEDFVGVPLFRRSRHGVALTDAGRAYAQTVAQRLSALEQDTLELSAHRGQRQALHLAAVPTFATRWLIPRLPQLQARHPHWVVHIETRTRPFLFTESPFGAAIFAGTPEQVANWPGTQATALLAEEVIAVASPRWMGGQTTLSAPEMAELPLLQQSTRVLAWRQWFDAQGVAAPQALAGPRLELFSMTAAAAAAGLGLALVPRLLVEPELASGTLVQVHPDPLPGTRAYYLVAPTPGPGWLAALRSWLLEQLGTMPTPPNPAPP